ncbi:uncharacterized protein LOC114841537 [Diachasma alloeum]|uniref:uncharacterized protein LOC114841537 n=1 Tax=Diachasma alloeum TaxID=454923 RepID=UPI0010FBAC3C|nr:uncharacterized protein LOC114841537 [Diachasma alloeum]
MDEIIGLLLGNGLIRARGRRRRRINYQLRLYRRKIRDMVNPFDIPEGEFIRLFSIIPENFSISIHTLRYQTSIMARMKDIHRRAALDYMKENPALEFGLIKDSAFNSKAKLEALKDGLAAAINAADGGVMRKDGEQAMRSWKDWKRTVTTKAAKLRRHAGGTGGGDPLLEELDELERELLDLLGPESYGMPNIEEGGFPSSSRSSFARGYEPAQKRMRMENNRTVKTATCTSGAYNKNPLHSFVKSSFRSANVFNTINPARPPPNYPTNDVTHCPLDKYQRSSFHTYGAKGSSSRPSENSLRHNGRDTHDKNGSSQAR